MDMIRFGSPIGDIKYMKKHYIITSVIFIVVVGLALASNFIHWDETPLEQTLFAYPLAFGMLLQAPSLPLGLIWMLMPGDYENFIFPLVINPLISGVFYVWAYLVIYKLSHKNQSTFTV